MSNVIIVWRLPHPLSVLANACSSSLFMLYWSAAQEVIVLGTTFGCFCNTEKDSIVEGTNFCGFSKKDILWGLSFHGLTSYL